MAWGNPLTGVEFTWKSCDHRSTGLDGLQTSDHQASSASLPLVYFGRLITKKSTQICERYLTVKISWHIFTILSYFSCNNWEGPLQRPMSAALSRCRAEPMQVFNTAALRVLAQRLVIWPGIWILFYPVAQSGLPQSVGKDDLELPLLGLPLLERREYRWEPPQLATEVALGVQEKPPINWTTALDPNFVTPTGRFLCSLKALL